MSEGGEGLNGSQRINKKMKVELINQTYSTRAKNHSNPMMKRILNLIESKKSNLCLSLDVVEKSKLVKIIEVVGDHVCMIKTHIDIVEDFDQDLIIRLKDLSERYNFIIFEDRKFADIGNTVKYQYSSGIYKISSWSHLTNAHTVPGESIIRGLSEIGEPLGRGLLLLAEMSSSGNLAKGDYTIETVRMARKFKGFVIGFISQRRLEGVGYDSVESRKTLGRVEESGEGDVKDEVAVEKDGSDDDEVHEDFLVLSPGVGLDSGGDKLGQNYRSPEQVIFESGSDIVIVGRGIYGDLNETEISNDQIDRILNQTLRYKKAGWDAYLKRIGS